MSQVTEHIKRHRFVYGVAAGVGIAGITAYIMKGCIETLALRGVYGPETADTLVTNHPFFSFFSGQSVVNIRNHIGRPSYLIHDTTTDLYYRSQRAAAEALSVSDSHMSNHIHGLLPHIAGHYLERVPIT